MTSEQDKPHINPSETESSDKQSGDPGRTPGKAEGEDDESATDDKESSNQQNDESRVN